MRPELAGANSRGCRTLKAFFLDPQPPPVFLELRILKELRTLRADLQIIKGLGFIDLGYG